MRKAVLIAVVVIALASIGMLFMPGRLRGHKLELRAYFQDARGLRSGAPVRLAGVDVGVVTRVRARPDMQSSPAEIVMGLNTPYELNVPSDSYVVLETAGILGETYASIDVSGTAGPAAKDGTVLKTRPTENLTKQFLQQLKEVANRPCDGSDTTAPSKAGPRAEANSKK